MFTGIIEDLGTVTRFEKTSAANAVIVGIRPGSPERFADVVLGESIAINGTCLTVAEEPLPGADLIFYVSPETLDRTQFSLLKMSARTNLERAMKVSDRLSGHIVQGHVDGLAQIHSIERVGESYAVSFRLPRDLAKYCIDKGSICLNGVSLTINRLKKLSDGDEAAEVMMIPHTWTHTQFQDAKVGDPVNLEVDVLAKYIERLCIKKD